MYSVRGGSRIGGHITARERFWITLIVHWTNTPRWRSSIGCARYFL